MDRFSSTGIRTCLFGGMAALIVSSAACSKPADEEAIESAEVPTISAETGTVARRDLVELLIVRGTIVALPNEDVRISALVPGRVMSMKVAEGDAVAANQIVAELDPRPFEDQRRQAVAALNQAKAALENARLNLARTERLLEKGIAAGKEVEDARAQLAAGEAGVEEAAAALDTADRQLSRTHVASPIAGQVVKRLVNVGEQVDGTAAQPLIEVANLDRVELGANVPAEHLRHVRLRQSAVVSSDAYPDRSFTGEVIAIAPAVDPATNAALVRIRVANTDRLLKVGMFAQASIPIQERRGVLAVPPSAVSKTDEGAFVYVVSGDVAARTPVKLGLETLDGVELLSGVKEGQKVLTSSIHGLGERARLAKAS